MQPGRLRNHSVKSLRPAKNIMVFCDGTAKNGALNREEPTNVWELYKLVKETNPTSTGQLAAASGPKILYIPGIGSGSSKNPLNLLCRIFGTSIVEIIVKAYLYVAKHYKRGDHICLFGYSRGAFVARKVASLIFRIGLIPDREDFLKLWQQQEKPVPWNLGTPVRAGKDIPIQCLAVWDTVGGIYTKPKCKMEAEILGMPGEELPLNVEHAFHVVAFHENRRLFSVTLFKPNGVTKLKEVWFPGAHSDVGGGGTKKTELPKLSLVWVIGELRKFLHVPHEQICYPDLEKLKPLDAYHDSPPWKRLLDKCETRLQSKALKPNSLVHETVARLRNAFLDALDPRPKSSHMLTINDLSAINWNIQFCLVVYNTFELLKRSTLLVRKPKDEPKNNFKNEPKDERKRDRVSSTQAPQGFPTSRSSRQHREIRPSIVISTPMSIIEEHRPRSRASSAFITNQDRRVLTSTSNIPPTSHRSRVESHAQSHHYNGVRGEITPKWSPIASHLRGGGETQFSGVAPFQEVLSTRNYKQSIPSNFMTPKSQQPYGDIKEKTSKEESSVAGGKPRHDI